MAALPDSIAPFPPTGGDPETTDSRTIDAVLVDLSEHLTGTAEPDAILGAVARIVGEHLCVSRVAYGEVDAAREAIVIPNEWCDGVPSMVGRHPLFRQSPFVKRYSGGETMAIGDVRLLDLSEGEQALLAATHCRSCISVPLVRDGQLVALFSATHRDTRVWHADEVTLVEHAAARTWRALEHGRVVARLRESEAALSERERHQSFLIDWADQIRRERTPEAIAQMTVDRLAMHFGSSRSSLALAQDDGVTMTIVAECRPDTRTVQGESYRLDRLGEEMEREFRAGRLVRFDDVTTDPRVPPKMQGFYAAAHVGGYLSVPLMRDGRIRAVLSVTQKGPRAWTQGETRLLGEIADRMWTILEKARAEAALQTRERQQAFLLDWSDGVREAGDEAEIVAFTIARLGRYLGTSRVNYAETRGKTIAVTHEWFADGRTGRAREAVSEGVAGDYLQGDVVVCEDIEQDARFDERARADYRAVEAGSFLAAPMIDTHGVRAILSVQDAQPRRWHRFEIQLLRDIAGRAWGMIERARVATALALRERDQNFLLGWSDRLRVEQDPAVILSTTLADLGRHLGASRACYSDIDMAGGNYTIIDEWRGDTVSVKGLVYPASNLSDEVRQTYLDGRMLVVDDMPRDVRFSAAAHAGFARAEIGARMSVPLSRDGVVQAILAIDSTTPRHWTENEIALVRELADRMWTLMERARAETALKERERHQAAILAWTDKLRDERTAHGMMRATLEHLGETMRASRINYAESDDDGRTLRIVHEWNAGITSIKGATIPVAAFGEQMRAAHLSGRPLVVADIADDPRFDDANCPIYRDIDVAALLSIALVRDGALRATLSIQQTEPRGWTPADVQLLIDLAERVWALLERRRSEQRLHESEALLAAFMDNAPIAMYLKEPDGRYVRLNREMAAVLGCEPEEALGRRAEDFLPPAAAAGAARLDRLALGGGVHSAELELRPGDRYAITQSVRFAVPDYDGRVTRLGGFVIDLTERRQAEAALERSRASLYQTEKLSALGSLLAGVSHELNNPLSIVVAQAVMLERHTAGTPLAERAGKIRKAADRCARIVQTFLAMARQKRPERRPVALNDVVATAVELTGYGVRADGISLVTHLDPALPQIAADADQLHQVLVNLIVNAHHALDGVLGDRRITLTSALGAEPKTVVLEIADTGPGVPEDARRRIFEPFFTTKPQGQGTGVGLSFSQGLVEAHGGRLTLMPSVTGAVFRVTLPVDRDQALSPLAPEPLAIDPPATKTALVVDDEPEIAEVLSDFLSLEGYACDVAIGGAAAIERLRCGTWDLVVSDIRMPGVDGPQLHAWLAVNRPDLIDRIAFATGDTLGTSAAQFLARVERPVLEKPFTPEAVRRFLAQVAP